MTTELVELAEAWEAEASQMDDDPDIFACLPHAVRQCATELRALASRDGGWSLAGECVQVGKDPESGEFRLIVRTTMDALRDSPALIFRDVTVSLAAAPEPVAEGSNNLSNDEEESP